MGSQRNTRLTDRQKTILIGKILGDATLEKNGHNVRLRIAHASKQKDYVYWQYEEFKNLATQKPRFLEIKYKGKWLQQHRFDTFSLPVFNKYRKLFYKNKKKIIPQNICQILNSPLSLAVWYMDDGYKRTDNSGLYLCSSSFTDSEHRLLQNCLKVNFGIKTNIHYAGGYARLHIPSKSKVDFINYISPYLLESMKYKVLLTP